jgi:hypothetical protein
MNVSGVMVARSSATVTGGVAVQPFGDAAVDQRRQQRQAPHGQRDPAAGEQEGRQAATWCGRADPAAENVEIHCGCRESHREQAGREQHHVQREHRVEGDGAQGRAGVGVQKVDQYAGVQQPRA